MAPGEGTSRCNLTGGPQCCAGGSIPAVTYTYGSGGAYSLHHVSGDLSNLKCNSPHSGHGVGGWSAGCAAGTRSIVGSASALELTPVFINCAPADLHDFGYPAGRHALGSELHELFYLFCCEPTRLRPAGREQGRANERSWSGVPISSGSPCSGQDPPG